MIIPRSGTMLLAGLLLAGSARQGAGQTPAISFLPPVQYAKPGVTELKAADLDGDGRIDLVAIGPDSASILYGRGDGTFSSRIAIPLVAGVNPGQVQIAIHHPNGDRLPDLIMPILG